LAEFLVEEFNTSLLSDAGELNVNVLARNEISEEVLLEAFRKFVAGCGELGANVSVERFLLNPEHYDLINKL
jgi:hypothetical protein